jgi:AcrR family transcriptional regulator
MLSLFTWSMALDVMDVNMKSSATGKRTPRAAARVSRQYHHGDLRQALIDAARHLLETDGLKQVTLRAACERVGVSIAAPYRHFGSREELLAAVLAQAFDELEIATRRAWTGAPDPSAALVAVGVAYVSFAHEHPNAYRAMFGGAIDKRAHPALLQAGLRALEVLQQAVRSWLNVGRDTDAPRDADEPPISLMAWSMAHGISTLALDGVLDTTVGGSADQAEDLFKLLVAALERASRTGRRPDDRGGSR